MRDPNLMRKITELGCEYWFPSVTRGLQQRIEEAGGGGIDVNP